jgi:hypothetical protein
VCGAQVPSSPIGGKQFEANRRKQAQFLSDARSSGLASAQELTERRGPCSLYDG